MSIRLTGIILQYIEGPYVVYLNIMLCQLYLSNTYTHTNTHNELHSVLKIQVYQMAKNLILLFQQSGK